MVDVPDTLERMYCAVSGVTFTVGTELDPPWTRGFHANATGTVEVVFAGESSSRTISVTEGAYYPYSIKQVDDGGSTTDILPVR